MAIQQHPKERQALLLLKQRLSSQLGGLERGRAAQCQEWLPLPAGGERQELEGQEEVGGGGAGRQVLVALRPDQRDGPTLSDLT